MNFRRDSAQVNASRPHAEKGQAHASHVVQNHVGGKGKRRSVKAQGKGFRRKGRKGGERPKIAGDKKEPRIGGEDFSVLRKGEQKPYDEAACEVDYKGPPGKAGPPHADSHEAYPVAAGSPKASPQHDQEELPRPRPQVSGNEGPDAEYRLSRLTHVVQPSPTRRFFLIILPLPSTTVLGGYKR